MRRRNMKAQSAMEYLMTYGWAILVIAIVMAALFGLSSITNGAGINTCVPATGFQCTAPSLILSGSTVNLTLTVGSATQNLYNVGFGCAAVSTSSGFPYIKTAAWNGIVYASAVGSKGAAATPNGIEGAAVPTTGALVLVAGQTVTFNSLICYDGTGNSLVPSSAPIGSTFTGTLWVNYTTASGATTAAGSTNPVLTAKFATITTKVV